MARYFIESVKCGVGEGGIACGPVSGPVVAEAKVRTDNGDKFYMSLAEVEGIPNFFKSPKSTYELQVEEDMDDEELEEFQSYFVETGDYEEIFEDPDPEWFQLYRYLIYIVRADWDECEEFRAKTEGKWLDEINVPASDLEEDYMEDYEEEDDFELPESTEDLYRLRLALEADVTTESVFHDMDAQEFDREKEHLQQVVAACESEDDYKTWKKEFVDFKMLELKNQKFLVCTYLFAGIGQYDTIIPEEGLEAFKCWINGNGSAFFGGSRKATVEEVKKFVELNAAK